MEVILSFLLGSLTGFIYNEHLYRQARRFPKTGFLYSFWMRFLFLFAVAFPVAYFLGADALLAFALGNLILRFLHTFLRAFVFVRY